MTDSSYDFIPHSARGLTIKALCVSLVLHVCFWMAWAEFAPPTVVNSFRVPEKDFDTEQSSIEIEAEFPDHRQRQEPESKAVPSAPNVDPIWTKIASHEPTGFTRTASSSTSQHAERPTETATDREAFSPDRRQVELPRLAVPSAPLVPDEVPVLSPMIDPSEERHIAKVAVATPLLDDDDSTTPSENVLISRSVERTNPARDAVAMQSPVPQRDSSIQRSSSLDTDEGRLRPGMLSIPKVVARDRQQDNSESGRKVRSSEPVSPSEVDTPVANPKPRLIDPPVTINRLAKQPAKLPGFGRTALSGIVTDIETGKPLNLAQIRIDRVSEKPLTALTSDQGVYLLGLAELPDNSAVTVIREGYRPETRNLGSQVTRLNVALHPIKESVISIESKPEVHHLGDDSFSGNINSQFQRKTEGAIWKSKFPVTREQLQIKSSVAHLSMFVKGMQFQAVVQINGTVISGARSNSPDDGSFGASELAFDPSILRVGSNEIRIQTVGRAGDLDDFEFVNVQIRIVRLE